MLPPEESPKERMERNLKNSATVIVNSSSYGDEIDAEINTAFTDGNYQKVLDIAAKHDVPGREALDAKIRMIPNPNFKDAVNQAEIQDAVIGKLIDAVAGRRGGEDIDRYLEMQRKEEEENERRRVGKMYEYEEKEPRFLFYVAGVDGDFKSAAKAIAAYQEKYGNGDRIGRGGARNAGFKRNPKYLNLDSPPEEVIQAIPKAPSLPAYLKEEEGSKGRPSEVRPYRKEAIELRAHTGQSMLVCLQALEESEGDLDKALGLLQKWKNTPLGEETR
jgi:hypothetical protein